MEPPKYISHLRKDEKYGWIFQSNATHEKGVSILAEQFATSIGCGSIGKILGELHDLGKEQKGFQDYIKKESGYAPSIIYASKTPHAYVGALVAKKMYTPYFPILSYPIASHHTGLYDASDFSDLMSQKTIPDNIAWEKLGKKHIVMPSYIKDMKNGDFNHFIRLLFSCLVDADYLDTEAFMDKEKNRLRKRQYSLKELLPKLENHLNKLSSCTQPTPLNKLRSAIQNICKKEAQNTIGFYSLTVPTGGGKTLASLLWAFLHAIYNHQERIIIAIPYTSIIVQTAATLRRIFGNENVCEHHSAFDADNLKRTETEAEEDILQQQRLASENWDYPIIVTTNVQLFESMFSNNPSSCRKLHNLANSVVILDEVQTLPLNYLQPIVNGLECYERMFKMSVLFTTASQPVLEGTHRGGNARTVFKGLTHIKEIIPIEWKLHEKLRRVNLCFDTQTSTYDDIANRLTIHDRVLCIVNTRQDAAEIFNRLPHEGNIFHLSRRMCPAHIQSTIEKIKNILLNPKEKMIRVVATQLIEAGVDIDFPVVFRQESGLDSILQAAGRCNREGILEDATTYIFKFNKALPRGTLNKANEARLNMKDIKDWFSPNTMHQYFTQLYARYESFDQKGIVSALQYDTTKLQFETAARNFKLIEDKGINVIVNYAKSCELIQTLKNDGFSYGLSKKLSKYMVNISQQDFDKLQKSGLVEEIIEGIYFLPDREQYDAKTGLTTESHWLDEILIQ